MLAAQGVSPEEREPYRKALDSDEALRAVYNYYLAIPLWMRKRLDPVSMPTMFIWPTSSENVASASIEANSNWVTGPYRLEIVEDVHQPPLQAAPERMTPLLLEGRNEWAARRECRQRQITVLVAKPEAVRLDSGGFNVLKSRP
jgi:hypothetical protein